MFDQVLVGAAPGDAITNCALGVKAALDQLGPSEMYAEFCEGEMRERFRHPVDLGLRPNRARPVIFHVSNGCGPLFQRLSALEANVIVWYHNISPAGAMAPFDPAFASDLIRGRWELEQLSDRTVLAIADSEFNAAELRALGFPEPHVVAPLPAVGRLLDVAPSPAISKRLDRWGPGDVVLVVGQQLPHKRIDRALAAVAVLQQEHLPDTILAVTGVWRLDGYSAPLRAFGVQCGLERVEWLGRVSDPELAALFDRAALLLIPSEHEGFCVPAIEAMAVGLPVVAARRAALPETVGDAGVLLDEPDDPAAVAALLHEVLVNDELRAELVRRGRARAPRFGPAAATAQLLDVLRLEALEVRR